MKLSRLEILSEFGFKRDPFELAHMETISSVRIRRLIGMAIDSKLAVSIVAESGTGKTRAVNHALNEIKNLRVVRVQTADRERITVADIERSLMYDLSTEPIKRTREVRARQLRRIIGEASRDQRIVLVLEEAHRMHGQTLRSLKSMLDIEWMGKDRLFSVIMISQYDPMRGKVVEEMKRRSDTVQMQGLTASETRDYVRMTVGKHFEADAIDAIGEVSYAQNFLDLQIGIVSFMIRALSDGREKVQAIDIYEGTGGNLSALLSKLGVTYSELEEETGISKTALNLVANNKSGTMTENKVQEIGAAIRDVLKKRTSGLEEGPLVAAVKA